MTPHQITAEAYFVRGKQRVVRNIAPYINGFQKPSVGMTPRKFLESTLVGFAAKARRRRRFLALCYFLNASGLFRVLFYPDCHVRAHLTAKRTPCALGLVDYLGVVVAGLVKQLAHPDIT